MQKLYGAAALAVKRKAEKEEARIAQAVENARNEAIAQSREALAAIDFGDDHEVGAFVRSSVVYDDKGMAYWEGEAYNLLKAYINAGGTTKWLHCHAMSANRYEGPVTDACRATMQLQTALNEFRNKQTYKEL